MFCTVSSDKNSIIHHQVKVNKKRLIVQFCLMFVGFGDSLREKGERVKINCSPNLSTNTKYFACLVASIC
jgi:hypothetical protein